MEPPCIARRFRRFTAKEKRGEEPQRTAGKRIGTAKDAKSAKENLENH